MLETFGIIVYGGAALIVLLGIAGFAVVMVMASGLHKPIVEVRDDEKR